MACCCYKFICRLAKLRRWMTKISKLRAFSIINQENAQIISHMTIPDRIQIIKEC